MTDMPSPDARPSASLGVLRWLAVAGLALVGFGVVVLVAMSELSAPERSWGLVDLVPAALGAVVGLVYLAAAVRLARPMKAQRLGVGLGWALLLATLVLVLPDLLRARISRNETATMGDLRALVSAETVPKLPPRAWGYERAIHAGDAPGKFAITAVPSAPKESGVRGFCADSTGRICFSSDGTAPPVRPDGTCDLDKCNRLQ